MNHLSREIARLVADRIRSTARSLPNGLSEMRSTFHGPPEVYLREVLDYLTKDGGLECELQNGDRVLWPVILPLESESAQETRLAVGQSGVCSKDQLIQLRNTPAARRWLALSVPGTHDAKSVSGTTDEFGIAPSVNGSASTIGDWLHDPFIGSLVDAAVNRHHWRSDSERHDARLLAEEAAHAAAEADRHEPNRVSAWALLSRLFDVGSLEIPIAAQWSLACGVPPTASSELSARTQSSVVRALSEHVQQAGYGACADRLRDGADEADSLAVDAMINHLRENAEVAVALDGAIAHFYAPTTGRKLIEPPAWWTRLTSDRLEEMLGEDTKDSASLQLTVDDPLLMSGKGLPAVVQNRVDLRVTPPHNDGKPVDIVIQRVGGGRNMGRAWNARAASSAVVLDDQPPEHAAPLRYTATAESYRKASGRVVVLDAFEPAVVVSSRTAAKQSLPKRAKGTGRPEFECTLVLGGEGRHFLEIFTSRSARIGSVRAAEDDSAPGSEPLRAQLSEPAGDGDTMWGLEVEATSECHFDLAVSDSRRGSYLVRVSITCDDSNVEGCKSEFERLIRLNRTVTGARSTVEVQVDRQMRTSDLQAWMLSSQNCGHSFVPLVLATDCGTSWRMPHFTSPEGTVISAGQFIHDPRPRPEEMIAPAEFVEARTAIAERVRGSDGHGVVETAELGAWMGDSQFAELVDRYVRSYRLWLENDPDIASWVDTVMVCGLEADRALGQEPYAVILSPLHPLRFGWHALAQRTLYESWKASRPCPAASILDPDPVPDALSLPLRTATGGTRKVLFLSADSSSDYWSVLWNATQVASLTMRGAQAPFDRETGIEVGGIASGFSVSQVRRAMQDVAQLFNAKPGLGVLLTSATANGTACNDGIMDWARARFSDSKDGSERLPSMGSLQFKVFDERKPSARPEDAQIANLAEDTDGAARWYSGTPAGSRPDLAIIAQLETSNASTSVTKIPSALGRGALLRHRVRTQLQAGGGAFLSESRMSASAPPCGDALSDHVADLTARIENLAEVRLGFEFAPSVTTIQHALSDRHAEYVAVSSSAVDPACFLGGWLDGAYLWDYELPSYSQRSGDANGYYLISRVRSLDTDALQGTMARLPGCAELSKGALEEVLIEVSRRGIPTVRGLSAGHSGAAGDLGLFLAGRLLQDAFRSDPAQAGLLAVHKHAGEYHEVALVVPVDPFRAYLLDLQRALGAETNQRPDIVVLGLSITPSRVACRITPVEVKMRQGVIGIPGANDALKQARALGELMERLAKQGESSSSTLWRLAFQHLLLSMLDFGFRVYSQREPIRRDPELWATLHQRVASALLGEALEIEFDTAGRLIVFDGSEQSSPMDLDQDGRVETLFISPTDSASLLGPDAHRLHAKIGQALVDWRMLPEGVPRIELATLNDNDLGTSATNGTATPLVLPQDIARTSSPDRTNRASAPEGTSASHRSANESDSAPPSSSAQTPSPESELLKPPALPKEGSEPEATKSEAPALGIVVRIGATTEGFDRKELEYSPCKTDLNQLNMGVVGDLGTGKTQLIKSLIYQISSATADNGGVKPRFLIFDYKRDYQSPEFIDAVGATVVEPYDLPLNLFDTTGVTRRPAWLPRFKFFADTLDKIYGNIGPVQRKHLSDAVQRAHEAAQALGRAATIYDVRQNYESLLNGKVDAPLSIINELTISQLFRHHPEEGATFDKFFDGVVVISLADLGQDDRTKNLLVAIFLNLFYESMLRLPKRPYRGEAPQLRTVDSYLLVDEADNIMKYEFDVLKSILLQGREFGVGVILASQYLRHFKVGATDYREPLLTWFIHKVPDLKPNELSALGLSHNLPQLAERVKHLQKHQCLYKTHDVSGEVVTGIPFYRLTE